MRQQCEEHPLRCEDVSVLTCPLMCAHMPDPSSMNGLLMAAIAGNSQNFQRYHHIQRHLLPTHAKELRAVVTYALENQTTHPNLEHDTSGEFGQRYSKRYNAKMAHCFTFHVTGL